MKRLTVLAALLAPFCANLFPLPAHAHAHLDHAIPALGSTMTQAPREVRLWFTQKLEPSFSGIEVLDSQGARVDRGDAAIDPQDRTVLHASLKPLGPGTYKVVWHVVSVDTHASQGDFTFTVKG